VIVDYKGVTGFAGFGGCSSCLVEQFDKLHR
jgi:hypothetical protein